MEKDTSRIIDGLCEIKDFITTGANMDGKIVTDNDIAYFEEIIESAKDKLLED